MAEQVTLVPKKQRGPKPKLGHPLPVPDLEDKDENWPIYEAIWDGLNVVITDPATIAALYENGSFGKGNFSRSKPVVGTINADYSDPPVLSQRRYTAMIRNHTALQSFQDGKSEKFEKSVTPSDVIMETNPAFSCPYVVVDDSDSDTEPEEKDWHPRIEYGPPPTPEHLQLLREEAFFLHFTLLCLKITTREGKALNELELWNKFRADHRFVPRYVAYHYFRQQGWVVKSGLKYGSDYLLYKDGPAHYHASYSVIVKPKKSSGDNSLYWRDFAAVARVAETASKELLVCTVLYPDLQEAEWESPEILARFTVQNLLWKRWLANKARDENPYYV